MDAAREGHADIASMLREAGASDATLAAEAAPVHKVQCHITARWLRLKSLAHTPSCPQPVQGAVSVRVAGADYGSVDSTSQLRNRRRA